MKQYASTSITGSFQQSHFVRKEIYQQRLDVLFQRLVDQGLIDYFERRVLRNVGVKNEKFSSSDGKNLNIGSVTFNELKFMLIVMLIGMCASILTFILEIIVSLVGKCKY